MISFLLLKICAFLFASAHLSFLPYCQLHQPEKSLSVMPSNNERTYIMVKVRSITLIARFLFIVVVLACGIVLMKEPRIGHIVYYSPTASSAVLSETSFPALSNAASSLSP
jgi:hypothetical protein